MEVGTKYPILFDVFKPLYRPTNRNIRRAMFAEYDKIFLRIWEVESSFYAHLFGDNVYEYDLIYDFHKKWLKAVVEHTIENQKPIYWHIRYENVLISK